ncbi:MAG: hypothetical protein HY343_00910 [Lentisphaerae bacterium]|nr:hypothetical protein [Lentisphaerota bacterium]
MNAGGHRSMLTGTIAGLGCIAVLCLGGCDADDPFGLNDETNSVSGLTLVPDAVTLSLQATNVIRFVASDGTAPYTWTLSNPSLGTLYTASNNTAFYQSATNAGVNLVTVNDADNNTATATVTQQ